MHEVLYAPALGYYASGATKFAAGGDFTTAPEISPLFAGVLARQCAEIFAELTTPTVVEFGAGTGALAADLLQSLAAMQRLPDRYVIVEVSADLQARQRARLAAAMPDYLSRIEWIADPTALRVDGVLLANEVLDALPVERFRIEKAGVSQQIVTADGGALAMSWREAPSPLVEAVAALQSALETPMSTGFVSEICLAAPSWLSMCADIIQQGAMLFSDYGYGQRDFYAPDRDGGTLMCHFRHHAHGDALHLPGVQDVTAWVNFTQVAEALDAAGCSYLGFTSQSQFLIEGGITQLLADGEQSLAVANGVKTLMLPGEMGERFRFIGFAKAQAVQPSGFGGRDYGWQL